MQIRGEQCNLTTQCHPTTTNNTSSNYRWLTWLHTWEKELLSTMTRLRLESLVRLWWVFSVLLFDSNLRSHNSQGADWLLWHSKLMTLYTVSYEIKYTAVGLSCVRSKIQQLCLIRYAIDLRWYLLRWTPHCMVLASSTNFIEDY